MEDADLYSDLMHEEHGGGVDNWLWLFGMAPEEMWPAIIHVGDRIAAVFSFEMKLALVEHAGCSLVLLESSMTVKSLGMARFNGYEFVSSMNGVSAIMRID